MNTPQTISVIIADDESSIRNGLLAAIPWKELNMAVTGIVKDGMEAWEFIQTNKPDIVITDIRMPRLSGLELIKRCHDSHLDCQFILLSGYDEFSYAQAAIRYGARAYVLKPLKRDELIAELENLEEELKQKKSERQNTQIPDYDSFKNLSRRMFFNQLIHHEFHHGSDINHRLSELQLPLDDSPYQIIVFSLCSETPAALTVGLSQIREILSQNTNQHQTHVWENDGSFVVLLLPLKDAADTPTARSLAADCLQYLRTNYGLRLLAGIGTVEQELLQAGRSYGMAVTALSYQLYESDQDLYDQSVLCSLPPAMSTNSIDTSVLMKAIRRNDRPAIKTYCREFFQSLLYTPMPPPGYIRGMTIYLVTDVQNTLRKEMERGPNDEFPYVKINQITTFRQIAAWSTSLFLQYGDLLSPCFASRKDQIILDAKEYIKNHIHQKIQAEDVAATVNLSPSYFAIYFKAKTGTNFRDYVLNGKMEHAKLLLESTHTNISETAYAVGYDDYRSFYRAFKNHTGMTPSEYQAKYQ